MDRTLIAPYKAEEKELSEKLYKKLEGLMLLHPPTDEFRKCCTNEMFLKPNQMAFFQVMKYLFRLHDPIEFKKRFYWPILDKCSEAKFRSSTVEYLKFLSEKHQLNWNIKAYLTIMPGGMKFISFLLDLIGFIVQEQIRNREKQLGLEVSQENISELNLKRMLKQNGFLKEYASSFIATVDEEMLKLRNNTEKIKQQLLSVESEMTNCPINKEFIYEFNESNKELFQEKYVKYSSNIISLEKPLNDLKESIDKFQNKATELRKDKCNLKQSLQRITSMSSSSDYEDTLTTRLENCPDGPTMNSLVSAFVLIAPTIDKWIGGVIENNIDVDKDVTSELFDLKSEFRQIEAQIIDYQKNHNPVNLKDKEPIIPSIPRSPLILKYVFTPPIKLSIVENISARLPLQDETNLVDRCSNYLANTIINTCTARKRNKDVTHRQSFDLNSTLNHSKVVDPVQLLRTIYKNSAETSKESNKIHPQQRTNLSLLSLKWKERQEMMFGSDKESETTSITVKTNEPIKMNENVNSNDQHTSIISKQTPKTPFNMTNSGEVTRIAVTLSLEKSSPSTSLLKKPSIVRKVQHSLLNIQNMSTSPSGRLEPLLPAEEYASIALENFNKLVEEPHSIDLENDANILNTPISHRINLSNLDDDAIFNTSDTILNEIV